MTQEETIIYYLVIFTIIIYLYSDVYIRSMYNNDHRSLINDIT